MIFFSATWPSPRPLARWARDAGEGEPGEDQAEQGNGEREDEAGDGHAVVALAGGDGGGVGHGRDAVIVVVGRGWRRLWRCGGRGAQAGDGVGGLPVGH